MDDGNDNTFCARDPWELLDRLAEPALFLDLDGTLVALAARPEQVAVSEATRTVLQRLQTQCRGALAILTGRPIQQVDALLAPLRVCAAGVHGAELRLPGGARKSYSAPVRTARLLAARCRTALLPAGVWLEEKDVHGFAFHYRAAPRAKGQVDAIVDALSASSGGAFRAQNGNCVTELKPAGCSKGSALRTLMHEPTFAGRFAIALGDDLTDEYAFAEAERQGGAGIVVGDRESTHASFRLRNPDEVLAWLTSLSQRLEIPRRRVGSPATEAAA